MFSGMKRKREKGQAIAEYALMMVMTLVVLVTLLLFLGAFTNYGARLIGLVAWEPNPIPYDAMTLYAKD
ncbi:MAG: hypothetical protein J6S53_00795 [Lentisphaeria bacterium]|nr:hypothetical protein [Lentisphaeria bacterium]